MSYNPKNLKDKIDRILEQNKRQQQQIPQNFIKGWRQSISQSTQPKSAHQSYQLKDKHNLQINTNNTHAKARSANSWTGDNQNSRLRISTTPNNQSSNSNKENIFRRNEFLSTKNSSVKGNNKKKIDYNFNLTNDGIQIKNQNLSYYQNYLNNKSGSDKSSTQVQNDNSTQSKSPSIDNSKTFLILKQHDSLNNGSKDVLNLNDSNSYNSQNNQTCISALQQNINLGNNSNMQLNKSLNSSQNGTNKNANLNLTSSSLQSTAAKNLKENFKKNQAFNNSSSFVNTNSPVASGNNKLQQNGSNQASNSKIQASPQSEIVNQLIKIIEQDKKQSAKQFQQFQNQQHQNSLERIRKRESFSLQMRQVSQNIDAPSISKRGSNFGLLDSNNNYQNSEEDNLQRVRELKTKYHLRDAILRQEIKRLEQENIMLKSSNKQLDEEVNRYRNIRTMENKYIKKLEQELIEEKQKYQVNFKKIANGECISSNSLVSTTGGGSTSNNNQVSFSNQNNGKENNIYLLKSEPITQQNSYQIAKYQEKLIQTLSEKVTELMNEKEYLEQILKNLLLKNEMDKQNKYDSLSFEISQQKPSYLNTSFSDNSCFAQFKASTSNLSYPNIQTTNLQQVNVNVSQQKMHPQPAINNIHNLANSTQACHKQISQIKEEYMEESSRVKTSQTSSQHQSQQQAQHISNNSQQQSQQQKENLNILNNILEKNKNLALSNNGSSNSNQPIMHSRNSETPRQSQKRQLSGSKDPSYPPQAPSSLNSIKRYTNRKYQDSSERNSNTNSIDGFIFGPPKSAHQCSYEEQLITQQQQNNKVIFLENQENEEFYWDPDHDEIVINEVQLKNLIEDYKRRAQKVDLL